MLSLRVDCDNSYICDKKTKQPHKEKEHSILILWIIIVHKKWICGKTGPSSQWSIMWQLMRWWALFFLFVPFLTERKKTRILFVTWLSDREMRGLIPELSCQPLTYHFPFSLATKNCRKYRVGIWKGATFLRWLIFSTNFEWVDVSGARTCEIWEVKSVLARLRPFVSFDRLAIR